MLLNHTVRPQGANRTRYQVPVVVRSPFLPLDVVSDGEKHIRAHCPGPRARRMVALLRRIRRLTSGA